MKDVTMGVFVEHAATGKLVDPDLTNFVVVIALAFGDFVGPEGDMEIEIEVAAGGRYPLDMPSHALFEGFDFRQRSTRHGNVADIALLEMDKDAVDVIELLFHRFRPRGARGR